MTTKFSSAVWRAVPQIAYMQFPWRFLVISTAGMCVLGGGAASNWAFPSRLRFISALVLSGAAVFNLVLSVLLIARAPFGQEALDASTLRREVPEYRTPWWDGKLHGTKNWPR